MEAQLPGAPPALTRRANLALPWRRRMVDRPGVRQPPSRTAVVPAARRGRSACIAGTCPAGQPAPWTPHLLAARGRRPADGVPTLPALHGLAEGRPKPVHAALLRLDVIVQRFDDRMNLCGSGGRTGGLGNRSIARSMRPGQQLSLGGADATTQDGLTHRQYPINARVVESGASKRQLDPSPPLSWYSSEGEGSSGTLGRARSTGWVF